MFVFLNFTLYFNWLSGRSCWHTHKWISIIILNTTAKNGSKMCFHCGLKTKFSTKWSHTQHTHKWIIMAKQWVRDVRCLTGKKRAEIESSLAFIYTGTFVLNLLCIQSHSLKFICPQSSITRCIQRPLYIFRLNYLHKAHLYWACARAHAVDRKRKKKRKNIWA